MFRNQLALACLTIAAMLLAGSSAKASPLPENNSLDVKRILRHKDSSRFTLIAPRIKVAARASYFPVHVAGEHGGAFALDQVSQTICSMVHPGLIAVGSGTTATGALAVKINDQGTPLSLFRPRNSASPQVFSTEAGAQALSHVTCATHR